uniref:Integrase catalytic domain-containing protein n=1 Tax=Tanacetum cinerariifolium TaxID=118510 RepID=A0A6L2KBS1_TANCI|nr:hypothetical protein [Tanacetum cinerariifolium]
MQIAIRKNGNSFKPVPRTTRNADGTSASTIPGPVTTEEKAQKKNDVKARSMLLMALSNENLLTFGQYKDAKTLFEATQARFECNDATKKTQKTLLKQMYENFNAPSTESLDSIFNMLPKIISQLAILGENISQEDLNMKFLRSLPFEWNTHVVVWRNKADLNTMSIDDLYNNFKIVEQEVKRTVTSSSSSGSQNMAFLSFPGSINKVDTANIQVSTVSTPVSIVNSHDNTTNLSDATMYDFLANQPNGSQLVHKVAISFAEHESKKVLLENWIIAPPTIDLSNFGLEEFYHPEFKGYGPRDSKSVCVDTSNENKKVPDALIIKDWVFDSDEDESEEMVLKSDNVQHKPEQANQPRKASQNSRNNRTNWNQMRTQKLGVRNFVPTAVLTKSGIVPISTARKSSSRAAAQISAARPINTAAPKPLGDLQDALKDTRIFDSGCSRNMTGNKSYLTDYQEYDRGFIAFTGSSKEGKITGKGIENQLNHKVKIIRCDNMTELKNYEMNQFYGIKGIKKEYSNARNPQQNRVAKRKNRTLIEAAKTMLADSLLPIPFWAEAVNTPCYVQNRVLVTKTHNKTPYELLIGRTPIISFMIPFGCLVTILNTLDHLGSGLEWLFDIDSLTSLMNYQPVSAGNRTNGNIGSEINSDAGQAGEEKVPDQEYILLPLLNTCSDVPSSHKELESSPKDDAGKKSTVEPTCIEGGKIDDLGSLDHQMKSTDDSKNSNSTNSFNTASPTVNVATALHDYSKRPNLEDTGIFDDAFDDRDEGAEADYNNLEIVISVSPIPSTRIHKDHPKEKIIREMEPKKVTRALDDESWVEAMQEELFQFKLLNVWTLVYLPHRKRAICTKWVYRNKRDQRGIVVKQQKDGIFLSQDKYVCDILKKFGFSSVKLASTPMETYKPLSKDANDTDVDVHLDRFQVQPKVSYMHAVKRIFRYLKGQPTLGLWYPKDSPLELIAYSDSDYAGASLDRKSITGGCQFLDSRLISWQSKKQTIVANSITEAEYIAASNCYGQLKGYLINDGYADLVQHVDKKELDIPWKMANGKEFSNPLMAEKSDDNTEFHQIVDFLSSCSITYALTVSPTIYASYIEQFWNTASSKTINYVKQIHAIVDGKAVVISESSVRSDLLFDDEDGNGYRWQSQALRNHGRVSTLENELSSNKAVYHKAFITLTKRVKKLETQLKHKRSRAVIHSSDEEEPSVDIEDSPKQGRTIKELDKDDDVNLNIKRSTTKDKGKGILQETELPKKIKKREMIHDEEVEEMKLYIRIVPDEDIAIDAIPLATKPPVIVEYKIVKEGRIGTYHIIRADGSTKRYTSMINLLENINRKDSEALWKLVKYKHGNTRPEEGYERVL